MWRWFVVAHLVCVVVGFGPLFVYPVVMRAARPATSEARAAVLGALGLARRRVSEPAFLAVLPFGLAAALAHPDDRLLHRGWLQVAIGFMVVAVGFVLVVQRPLAREVARLAGELTVATRPAADALAAQFASRCRWLTRATWVSWAGLGVMLWLMVAKPGA
jgi:uncharacterized membrane protein